MARTVRLLGTLVAISVYTAPTATAVTPPPVDDSLLPKPASAAPPERTEQHDECVGGAPDIRTGDSQLKDLDVNSLWQFTRGAGQTVAVIDTGVSRHRLLPHLVAGGDYVSTGDGTEDCDGHGTMVAGIVGAAEDPNGANGFHGVAPDATIIGIRQSSNKFGAADDPSSSGFGDVDTLAKAVRAAADLGATVINVSSVACLPARDTLDDRALGAALFYAVDVKNAVVVAAAGNVGAAGQCPDQNPPADPARPGVPDWDDVNVVASPAWYDDLVLTVGSVGLDGAPSSFSLAGPWVDVAAPGEGVVSLDRDGEGLVDRLRTTGDEMPIAGTSYAAPVVTGIVALVRARFPELTARQVMQRIEDTAQHPAAGWDPVVGHGIVDAHAAVTGGPATPPAHIAGQPISVPSERIDDRRSEHVAVQAAAICMAVSAAVVGMSASHARLRRRPDAVTHD